MRMKWLALVLAGVMCVLPALGLAEAPAAFDATVVAPLLNAVTSAALGNQETVTYLGEEEALSEAFMKRLITGLADNGLPADRDSLSRLVAMSLPAGEISSGAAVEKLTLQVLTADVSEAGDAVMLVGDVKDQNGELQGQRAIVELRREDASPVGWKLYRFTVGDMLLEEALLEGFFAQATREYLNAACGYSIQYPAIFTENMIAVTATGIQAALPDESVSFAVMRVENSDGLSLDGLLALEKEADPAAVTSVDEVGGTGMSVVTDAEGVTHVAIFLVSEAYIYQAELNYPQDQAGAYESYVKYMLNSFSADELGLG